jgi:hypothetical protein
MLIYFSRVAAGEILSVEGTVLIRRCCRNLKMILGIIFSATQVNSKGTDVARWVMFGPWCCEQKLEMEINLFAQYVILSK